MDKNVYSQISSLPTLDKIMIRSLPLALSVLAVLSALPVQAQDQVMRVQVDSPIIFTSVDDDSETPGGTPSDQPLAFSYLPHTVRVGNPSSIAAPTVVGANGAVSFELASGTLPGTMTVSEEDGSISGIPQGDCAPCSAWIKGDDEKDTNTSEVQITVLPRPTVTTTAPSPVLIGSQMVLQPTFQHLYDHGEQQRVFSLSGHPQGMSISQVDGTITWTPNEIWGPHAVTVGVIDKDGTPGSTTFLVRSTDGIGDGGILQPTITSSVSGNTTTFNYVYDQRVRLTFLSAMQSVSSGDCRVNWSVESSDSATGAFSTYDSGGHTFAGCSVSKPRSVGFTISNQTGVVGQRFRLTITRVNSNAAGAAAANVGTTNGTW